ncbi:acyl carrier protein [Streptomyces gamaensis]|uniref:Acyl carrier protein n=1 Tax=Streptomyces gamaensis TaxID=1763542 RepID=A0ABW0Z3I9_9ACTN
MSTTYDRIAGILVTDLGLPEEEIGPDVVLEDLGLRSLDLVTLGVALQDELDLELEDIDPAETLGSFCVRVERKREQPCPPLPVPAAAPEERAAVGT